MSRSLSTRAIAAVAVLLAIVIGGVLLVAAASAHPAAVTDRLAGRHPPSLPIAEAVRRTLAEPAARVRFDIAPRAGTPTAGGPHVILQGVASLSSTDADLSASIGGRPMRVRMVGDRVWIRLADAADWVAVPAEALGETQFATWRRFLAALNDDPVRHQPTLDGRPATVDLDRGGRIRRIRTTLDRSTVDLRLDGYDDRLAMPAPP